MGLGYPSLFEYCTKKLGYSDSSAFRRVESARTIRVHPKLGDSFIKGDVSISTIATASKAIKAGKVSTEDIIGKSAREVVAMVANVLPVSKPKERITEIKVTPQIKITQQSINPIIHNEPIKFVEGSLLSMSEVNSAEKSAEKSPETRFEIKFSVTKEIFSEIQNIKARLSNKLGSDLSIENIMVELIRNFKVNDQVKERKVETLNTDTRYIPISVKREVRKRDNCQCSYVSSSGVRCTQKHYLHYDHVKPFAIGGKSNTENLRLLCSGHNKARVYQTFPEFSLL